MIDSDFPQRVIDATTARHGRVELWTLPLLAVVEGATDYLLKLNEEAGRPQPKRQLWLHSQRTLTALRLADAVKRLGIEPAAPAGGCCGEFEDVNAELRAAADDAQGNN